MTTTVAQDVQRNIDVFNAAYDRAESKWNAMDVRLNSWFGGVDPALVLGSITQVNDRADRWKQRGVALAGGHPLQLDDVNTNPPTKRTDTYAQWVELGNELIHELQTTAEDATNDSITSAVEFTVDETAHTVVGEVVDTAEKVNAIGKWMSAHKTLLLIVAVPLALLWFAAQLGLLGLFSRRRDA